MILDEIVDRITGRWAASFKAWGYLAFLGCLGTISRTYTLLDVSRRESILLGIGLVFLNAPIYWLISSTLLRKRYTEQLSLSKVLISYLLIWLSAASLEIAATVFVLHQTAYLGPQLFAPLFPDIFGFVASSYLLAEFEKNRNDIGRLEYARSTLVKIAKESKAQVVSERSKLIAAIQDSVFYQLDALKKQFNTIQLASKRHDIERLARELEEYSTNTIRTLSHEMATDMGESSAIDRLSFVGQKKVKGFSNVYAPYISFRLSVVGLLLVGGFHELSLNGLSGFVFQLLATAAVAPILLLGSLATRRCGLDRISLGFACFLITIFVSGYVTVIVSDFLLRNQISLRNEYTSNVFAARYLVSVILASLLVTIVEARRKTLDDLMSMNERLRIDLDWMDNRSHELRKELASILHGPLQGRIAGVAMALRLIAADEDSSQAEKKKKLDEIEKLLSTVMQDVQALFKLESTRLEASIIIKLINLRRSWDGIATVNWSIDPRVFAALPVTDFMKVNDILYESVSNSVRHGGGSTISITLDTDLRDLIMTIEDDGKGVSSEINPGAGFRKIGEFGGTYSFDRAVDRGANLTVRLPLTV
jgi:signal transduction histidine kinase